MKIQSIYLVILLSVGLLTPGITQEKLTLDMCREQAIKNNSQLKRSASEIAASQAEYQAANTNKYPQLDGNVSAFYLANRPSDLFPDFGINSSLNLNYPIYAGGKIKNALKASETKVQIAETQQRMTREEIVMEVDRNYWELISLQENAALNQEYQKALQALVKELEDYHEAGLIQKNDLLRVQVRLNEAKLQELQIQQGIQLSRMALAQKMGQPLENTLQLENEITISETETLAWQQASQQAGSNRPEITLLNQSVKITEIQQSIEEAEYAPQVGLSLGWYYLYSHIPNLGGEGAPVLLEENVTFLTPQLSVHIPIYRWGKKKHIREAYRHRLVAQEEEIKHAKEMISLEVQKAIFTLNESAQNIKLSKLSMEQTKENLRLLENQFEAGTTTGQDVLEAQVLWQTAYANYIDAKAQHKINQSMYQKSIGALTE